MPSGTSDEDDGSVTIAFDGIDADRRDASELEAFKGDLKTPARDDDAFGRSGSPLVYDGRSTTSPTAAMVGMGLVVVGVLTGFLLTQVGGWLVPDLGPIAMLSLFVIGCVAPCALAVLRERRGMRRKSRVRHERFTLRIDPSGLSVARECSATRTFDLAMIERFEGGRRIAVRLRDGTKQELPCALPLAADHAALAHRLDEAVASVRARLGGYRGEQVRIATSEPLDDDDERTATAERSPSCASGSERGAERRRASLRRL